MHQTIKSVEEIYPIFNKKNLECLIVSLKKLNYYHYHEITGKKYYLLF